MTTHDRMYEHELRSALSLSLKDLAGALSQYSQDNQRLILDPASPQAQDILAVAAKDKPHRVSALDVIDTQPWAITMDMLETMRSIAARENESPEAVAAKLGRPLQNTQSVTVRDGVAVLPVNGPIFRFGNLFTQVSGATSLERLALDFNTALNDSAVKAIVLNIDSPGGQATGIAEFAQMVRAADKPVTAYVGGLGASAAYWIAAAADEVVIAKTGEVGSIGAVFGVYKTRADDTVAEFVSSQSPMKRADPSSDEGRAEFQKRIDTLAQVFIDDVAQYRGVAVETVLSDFGKGGVRLGEEAVKLKMADRVSTLEQVIAGLTGNNRGANPMGTQATATPVAQNPAITRDYLAANHADLVTAIERDATAAAIGAERKRVQAILATPLAAHYADLVTAAIDKGDSAEQLAVAILGAEAQGRTDTLAKQKAEAPKPLQEPASETDLGGAVPAGASVEECAKAEWAKDAKLHAEFGTLERYTAFRKVEEQSKLK